MPNDLSDYSAEFYGGRARRHDDTIPNPADAFADADRMSRSADARPASWDPEAFTFEAVVATPHPVQRRDLSGPYLEVLDASTLTPAADLPVYDSHRSGSARETIGAVQSVRVEGDNVVAVLRLSTADDVEWARQRVADGTIRHTSVGYRIAGWVESRNAEGARVRSPKAWTLTEISLVPNPADPNARIRSQSAPDDPARSGGISNNRVAQKDSTMPKDTMTPEAEERTRRADLRQLARSANLTAETADAWIDENLSIDQAKAAAFDAIGTRTAPVIRTAAPANDDPATIRTRQADALAYRMGALDEMPEASRSYADVSLLDMARDSVERSGTSTRGMNRDEVLHRAASHTTSDFALTVMDATGKTAMASYRAAESPLKALARKQTLRDFKASTAVRLGEMGELEEMAENGEFTATSRAEEGEAVSLKTFGRRIDLSRNLIINDDLNLLADTVRAFGEAAAQTEAAILVELLTGNPKMRDGTPVFHDSRGNIGGAGWPDKGTLSENREAMRRRTGTDGKTIIDAAPRHLLVPADLETDAEEILAAIQPGTSGDVNPFAGKLNLLVEPRLPEGTWYLFADPARLASIRYAYLSGAEGVQVQRREAWDTLGLSFRGFLDFGAGWLDWRGAQRIATA